jgi:hypothetical protein
MHRVVVAYDHTQTHTLSTHLEEGSDRRRDLYLTTHNTHTRHTSMFQAGFKTRNPNKRAALDREATRIGYW